MSSNYIANVLSSKFTLLTCAYHPQNLLTTSFFNEGLLITESFEVSLVTVHNWLKKSIMQNLLAHKKLM